MSKQPSRSPVQPSLGSPQPSLPQEHTGPRPLSKSLTDSALNVRSCVTCRKRKVRCDKRPAGCLNCAKARIECFYPAAGRSPRTTRKPQDPELLARLNRLERVVQSLSAQVVDDSTLDPSPPKRAGVATANEDPKLADSSTPNQEQGRLVIHEGKSRYVSNALWACMNDEVIPTIIL
jgi:Fungal Zn(2)-Cys(6) binuclear cluster domain